MAGKEIKVSRTVKEVNGFKLNAQWLKNATKSLGSNASSVLQDISPNIYGVVESASQIKRTISRQHVSQNLVTNALQNNRYIKLGKSAIDNALNDLKHGNFDNSSRSFSAGNSDDSSSTYNFGEIKDEDEANGTIQTVVNFNPEGLNSINSSITKQTKFQMMAAKANVDTIVATSSAMMTMNQKNAEASLNMLSNINNSLQALVKYNNENVSKYINSSMAYYEMMGKTYAPVQSGATQKDAKLSGADLIDGRGNLNSRNITKLLRQNFKDRYEETMPGQITTLLDSIGDELVANPLKILTTTLMKNAIPKAVQNATKSLDKTFGNFITELLMRSSDTLKASTGKFSGIKQFMGSVLDINVDRRTKFDTRNKVTKDAAVFDGITRHAITDEIPKYLRESTSYLRQLVLLNGGNPDNAVAKSKVFNREEGVYQSYDDFSKALLSSIDKSVTDSLSNSDFGKSLKRVAESNVVGDQKEAFEALLNKFYLALERDEAQIIDISKRGTNTDISRIIGSLTGDNNLKRILEEAVYSSFQHGRGGININSARLNAKKSRNDRITELETENLDHISGFLKKDQTIDEALASVVYGTDGHSTKVQSYTPNSLLGKVTSIFDILDRGINVRVTGNKPYRKFRPGTTEGSENANVDNDRAKPVQSNNQSEQAIDSSNITNEELASMIGESMDDSKQTGANTKGKVSKFFVNKSTHLGNIMHYILRGDPSKVYSEMGAMFGEGLTDLGRTMNDAVVTPLKDSIFGKNADGTHVSISSKVKDMFGNLKNDIAEFVLGPANEEGKRDSRKTSLKGFLQEGLEGWSTTLFGPDKSFKDIKEELTEKLKKNSDNALKGAVAGAGLGITSGGILGTLVGGPLTGAVLGAATGFISKSDRFQKLVFGEEFTKIDENGNEVKTKVGGIIPDSLQKIWAKHKSDIVGAGALGALGGAVTGGGLLGSLVGGPIAGALVGSAIGIAKNSDTFKDFVFGKMTGEGDNRKRIGGIVGAFNKAFTGLRKDPKEKSELKQIAAMGTVGTGSGLLLSLFTPLGPIGGAALGLAGSMFASKDKFHDLLFGKDGDDSEHKGLIGRLGSQISTNVIKPLAGIATDALLDAKDAIFDKVLDPIVNLAEPLAGLTRRLYDRVVDSVQGAFGKLKDSFVNAGKGLGKLVIGTIMRIFNRNRKDKDKPGFFGSVANKLSDKVRKSNEKASSKKWYSDNFRTTNEYSDMRKDMINKWNKLSDEDKAEYGDIESFEKEFAKKAFYNGGDTREERKAERRSRREERIARRQERHDTINREALISKLSGGKYSTDTEENRARALESYYKTRGYKKSKGMSGLSDDEVRRLLSPDAKLSTGENPEEKQSEILAEQLKLDEEKLEALKEQMTLLDKIHLGISSAVDYLKFTHEQRKTSRSENRQARRDAKEDEKFARNSKMNSIIDDINDHLQEKRENEEDYFTSLNLTKKDARDLKKISNNPSHEMHRLANRILNKNTNSQKRIRAYAEYKELVARQAQAKAYQKEQKERRRADAVHAVHDIRRNTTALLNETGGKGYANGTRNAKPGDAVVGENGPEIVSFGGGERVHSNNDIIKVKLVDVDPRAAKTMNDNGTQDVNIIGQNGLIATYGTGAKLDNKTDNKSSIEKSLSKDNTLISYDKVKSDNDELNNSNGSSDNEKESFFDKLKYSFGGLGKLLLGAGGIVALVKLLSSDKVQNFISSLISVANDSAATMATVAKNDGYEGGADFSTNIKNQTSRWTSVVSNPSEFLLGQDGKVDSQTGVILKGGRQILNRTLNGAGKGFHPIKAIKNAVFHPFKTMKSIGSGIINTGKTIGSGITGIKNFITNPNKLDAIGSFAKNVVTNSTAGKQVGMIGNLISNFKGGGGLSGAYNIVKDSVDSVNPKHTGLSGWLTKTSDKLLNFANKHGDVKTQQLVGKLTGQAIDEASSAVAKESAQAVTKNTAESGIKSTVKSIIEKVSKFGAGKSVEEAGEEVAQKAVTKGATVVAKESAEATAEKVAKESILTTATKSIKEGLTNAAEALSKKFGGKATTIAKSVLSVVDDVMSKITKGLSGKMKSWILSKLSKLAGFLGITTGVAATGVGLLAVLAKDGVFLALGAINAAGKGGTARLFRCKQEDVDLKMQAISSAIGGLSETTVGTVVDIINEIYCAITGDDFITRIATLFYDAISNDTDTAKLKESQKQLETDWTEYKENFLKKEYENYIKENPESKITFEEYKNKVSKGELDSDVLGLAEYNDKTNKTLGAKVWDSTVGVAKSAGDAIVTGAKDAGDAIASGAKSVGNFVASGWSKLWGGKGGKGGKGGSVPFYSQKDPRWSNISYEQGGAGETIGDAGCGPTAFAMAASGATGKNIDPVQSAVMMKRLGARDNTGTNWGGIGKAANAYGIDSRMQQNPSTSFIDSELDAGNPVILSGRSGGYGNTPYTPQGHYVVATGRDNNGNYIINDPNRLGGSRKYKKSDMVSETGAAWGLGGRGLKTTMTAMSDTGSSSIVSNTGKQVKPVVNNTKSTNEKTTKISARQKWIEIIRAVKKAIASANAGYSQSNWITITVGEKSLKVRTDCSGYVTACLKFFGVVGDNVNIVSQGYTNQANQTLLDAGFSSRPFTSWNDLQEGDIVSKNGHVEIFARNEGNTSYVYNCGSDSSCNSPVATKASYKTYTTVWSPGEPGTGVITNTSVTSVDSVGNTNISTTDASASNESGGNFFSNITKFFTELGSRAVSGITSGKWNNDWSGVFGNKNSPTSTSVDTSTRTSTQPVGDASIASGGTSESRLWNLLKSKGLSDAGAAATMGNLYAESGLRTNNVENSYEKRVGDDATYTAKVDNGTYKNFANDAVGYGLAQWTYKTRKQALYDLAKQQNRSIADEGIQTTHLWNELSTQYKDVASGLINATSVKDASDLFMTKFERPKDQSDSAKERRASYAQSYYNKYATGAEGYGGYGNNEMITSTGVQSSLQNNRVISSTNENSRDLNSVIDYLSKILTVLGESSDKLNALNTLKNLANSKGNTINNNSFYSQTNNTSTSHGIDSGKPKIDTDKFATAQKIARGGL